MCDHRGDGDDVGTHITGAHLPKRFHHLGYLPGPPKGIQQCIPGYGIGTHTLHGHKTDNAGTLSPRHVMSLNRVRAAQQHLTVRL